MMSFTWIMVYIILLSVMICCTWRKGLLMTSKWDRFVTIVELLS
jgi:hypothetical protein